MVRALEHGRVTMSMEIESAPTVLYIYKHDDVNHVLFGTVDGRIGILDIEKYDGATQDTSRRYLPRFLL